MSAENVLVIYSAAQKVRRRTVVMDGENEDDNMYGSHIASMGPGEEHLFISLEIYQTFESGEQFDAYLTTLIGDPVSDYCAVVTGDGEIIDTVHADPRIDGREDGWLIQDDDALAGGTFDFETATAFPPEV